MNTLKYLNKSVVKTLVAVSGHNKRHQDEKSTKESEWSMGMLAHFGWTLNSDYPLYNYKRKAKWNNKCQSKFLKIKSLQNEVTFSLFSIQKYFPKKIEISFFLTHIF